MSTRLLLAVLLLASFTLTTLDTGGDGVSAPLRTAVGAVLGPVDRAVGGAATTAGDAVSSAAQALDGEELERLRRENARLRREVAAAEGDARTAREWRELLAAPAVAERDVLPARVVGAGSALGFERTLTLDVGERDGVATGMTVLAGAGLLGRTVRVDAWTCTVLLLDDPRSGVGARLAATGALGLVRGAGSGDVEWVQVDAGPVADGDALLTSGSDTFVPDVPIGRVRDVRPGESGLTTTARVDLLADPGRLELVGVVVDGARTEARPPLP